MKLQPPQFPQPGEHTMTTMRCQLTNESAGSSWHFGWNQPFQLCWGVVDSSSSDQVANGIPTEDQVSYSSDLSLWGLSNAGGSSHLRPPPRHPNVEYWLILFSRRNRVLFLTFKPFCYLVQCEMHVRHSTSQLVHIHWIHRGNDDYSSRFCLGS